MKKTGICPKCGSNEVKGFYKPMSQMHVAVLISKWHSATLETLSCANCGYTEFYSDEKGIENLRSEGKTYTP